MGMKMNKIIGVLLLVLALAAVVGMVLNSDAYWNVYNCVTILICGLSGILLLKQK